MTKRICELTIILLVFGLSFCTPSNHCECADISTKEDSVAVATCNVNFKKLSIPYITSALLQTRPNPGFNFTLFQRNNKLYFTYVTTQNKLTFANIEDSTERFETNFPFFGGGEHLYLLKFYGDTLFMLAKYDTVLYRILIDKNFSATVLSELNLNRIIKLPLWFIHYNYLGNSFGYHYPYLLVPYGIHNKSSLIDTTGCLMIDLTNRSYKQVITFPQCYKNCYLDDENVSLAFGNNKVYGLFSHFKIFSSYSLAANSHSQIVLPGSSNFLEFDKKEIRNLAYTRKYESLVEENVQLFFLDNFNKYIIIKKLKKQNWKDPNKFKYYIYDRNDKVICTGYLPFVLFPRMIFPTSKGFVAFDQSLSNVYYYEID